MNFLQPEALFWMVAVVVPLAFYFFRKKSTRPQPWAAGKFLQAAINRLPAHRAKGERNLVLVRCLIIFFLCHIIFHHTPEFAAGAERE